MVCFLGLGDIFSHIFMVTPEKLRTFILSKNRERLWQRIRPSMCVRIADRNHRSGWGVVLRAGNGILLRNSLCVRRVRRPSRQEDSTRRCRGTATEAAHSVGQIVTDEEPRLDMHDEELNRVLAAGWCPAHWCFWVGNPA